MQRAAIRRGRVLQLRLAGASCRTIAAQVGVGVSQVQRDIDKALADEAPTEEAEKIRKLQMQRYDKALLKLYPLVFSPGNAVPDFEALREWLKVMTRIDRIHGIEARPLADVNIDNVDARTQVLIADGGDARELLANRVAAYLERSGPPESPGMTPGLTGGNGTGPAI